MTFLSIRLYFLINSIDFFINDFLVTTIDYLVNTYDELYINIINENFICDKIISEKSIYLSLRSLFSILKCYDVYINKN